MLECIEIKEVDRSTTKEIQQEIQQKLNHLFPKRHIDKVLFINPPDVDKNMFNYVIGKRARYSNYPPYGVGMIASHLRKLGIQVDVLNLNYEILKACYLSQSEKEFDHDAVWKSLLKNKIDHFRPDFVGVTCMFSLANNSAKEVCNEIKELSPEIPLAIGGVHITNCFINKNTINLLLDDFKKADLFFLYESESAFKFLVKAVNKEIEPDTLYQVFFNFGPEKLYFPEKTVPTIEDLSVIPAHDLISTGDLGKFGKIGAFYSLKDPDTKFGTVLSNRGCRAQCTFCSVRSFNGMGVRRRKVQSVVDELIMLRDDFGINHIMWLDDDFLFDTEQTLDLFNEMVKRKVGITWDCTNGVISYSCTDEIISAAAESGCIGLVVGVESGSREILKQVRKPGTPETFLKAASVLKKYEQINSRAFLMLGFPGETYRMLLDTLNLAMQMDLDWYSTTILQPLPNTPIFDSMVQQGLVSQVNFQDIRFSNGVYGKMRQKATKLDLLNSSFKDAFEHVDLDTVPSVDKLDDVWAYMNFHLNFKRLFKENRHVKLVQMYKYVKNIADIVAPESGFAIYFTGYLQYKLFGEVEQEIVQKLENCLQSSPYWAGRFEDFGLSIDHLKTRKFPQYS